MAKNLYVGNLSFEVESGELTELFSRYGTVESAQIVQDKYSGASRGFGFVNMSSDEEANAAIAALNDMEIKGRKIVVNEAKPQKPRSGGGDRGGRSGGGGYGGGRGGGGGGRGGDRGRGGSGGGRW